MRIGFSKSCVFALAFSATLVLSAAALDGPQRLAKRGFSGRATYYETQTGSPPACSGMTLSDNGWTVALNSDQYDGGSHCGQKLIITYNGNSQTVSVADECPGCPYGGLDLTPGLFVALFGSEDIGEGDVTWDWAGGQGDMSPPSSSSSWVQPTSTWTPSSTWSPSSSYTPQSTYIPSSSSSKYTPSSSVWTSSSTWTPSSSSSIYSPSSSFSASSSSYSRTSSSASNFNTTSTLLKSSSVDSTSATTTNSVIGYTANSGPTATGAINNVNQVILQIANMVVNAVES